MRFPGSADVSVFPATAFSHWVDDPETGEQTKVTYAERFSRQYRQFKAHGGADQDRHAADARAVPDRGRRAEMRAQNIYTVERWPRSRAGAEEPRPRRARAEEPGDGVHRGEPRRNAPNLQLPHELEALKARNAVLEEDAKR